MPNCCSTGCLPDDPDCETGSESEESDIGDASAAECGGAPLLMSPRVTGERPSLCALKAQKLQPGGGMIPLRREDAPLIVVCFSLRFQ